MKSLTIIGFIFVLLFTLSYGRRYNKCSLARELYRIFNRPEKELINWVCLAEYESNYDTETINRNKSDGSWDWGIFQINDEYWCHNPKRPGKSNICGIDCERLANFWDITASVQCVLTVRSETKLGWNAWTGGAYCRDQRKPDISACGDLSIPPLYDTD